MKNKRLRVSQNRLLELALIKSQHKTNKNFFTKTKYLLPALKIIYKYHINNKKILFIGLSGSNLSKTKKKSNHIYLPSNIWFKGSIINKKNIIKYLQNKNIKLNSVKLLINLIQKPDLVVILDSKTDNEAINECHKAKLPIISLNSKYLGNDFKSNYEIPNSFITESKKNTIIPFLVSILKKDSLKRPNLVLNNLIHRKRKLIFKRKNFNLKKNQ